MYIGVNFFGLRRNLYYDFEGTLDTIKNHGFQSVEVCIGFGENAEPPEEFKQKIPPELLREMSGGIWDQSVAEERLDIIRAKGLLVVSAHIMLGEQQTPEEVLAMLPQVIEFGKNNQISYFVISLAKKLPEMKLYIDVVRQMSEALEREGMTLAYHNHEIELVEENGETALAYILEQCPLLKLELDVGWAKFAGASVLELMRTYRDRLELLHLKDIKSDASEATRTTCFTAVGEGSIPLKEILLEASDCPIVEGGIIIDQDDSEAEMLDDLVRGVKHVASCKMHK